MTRAEPSGPPAFECARCGACCRWPGPVRVDDAEIDAIAAFLSIPAEIFIADYTCITEDRRGLSLTEREDGSCVFYEMNPSRCAINAVKPSQCRGFPLDWNFPGWEKLCAGSGKGVASGEGGKA